MNIDLELNKIEAEIFNIWYHYELIAKARDVLSMIEGDFQDKKREHLWYCIHTSEKCIKASVHVLSDLYHNERE